MYILRKDNIIKVNINIDNAKLNDLIEIMEEKRKLSIENDIIYSKFISLVTEIRNFGFMHDGKNLLEFLTDYKLYQRYKHEASLYLNKKIMNPKRFSEEEKKKIILTFPNNIFAGLYGEKLENDLNNVIDCFTIEKNNDILSISHIEIHKKITDACKNSNKEALNQWKNLYFSSVRNNNLINILNIKENFNKEKIIKQ